MYEATDTLIRRHRGNANESVDKFDSADQPRNAVNRLQLLKAA
jgi:hypothetical protein